MPATEVGKLQTAAEYVTRQLPEAHIVTRRYRALRFRAGAKRFLSLLYRVDVQSLEDHQLEEVERLTRVALKAVEIHMLLRFSEHDTAECRHFTDLINQLRQSLDALAAGLPTDPNRQPSREDLLAGLAADLQRAGVR
jgi:hypothetical protein